ncbi:MAG: shikimate dehydrogenase [Dehalococcoidales bacterium]|nr:shikimate dehydrogenase [Dehalococcoidales bacterium]
MKDRAISGKTKLCGIIGDPIEHTMSPIMHNTAFKTLGLDYVYVPFKVKNKELKQAIEGVRTLNIRGINVTIPHKVAVLPLLDKIDSLAEKIGAVNTIVNDEGVLTGYNTDAYGFLQALLEKDINPRGKRVLVLGAGGAAKAICFILAEQGASLVILNRKLELEWAQDLARHIKQNYSINVSADELNKKNLAPVIPDTDILVNATSVGMSPNSDETPVDTKLLCSNLVVFDIIYNPLPTRLLQEAKAAGARTIDGLEMLVWQGALSFEKWIGRKPPVDLMRQSVMRLLQKNEN